MLEVGPLYVAQGHAKGHPIPNDGRPLAGASKGPASSNKVFPGPPAAFRPDGFAAPQNDSDETRPRPASVRRRGGTKPCRGRGQTTIQIGKNYNSKPK